MNEQQEPEKPAEKPIAEDTPKEAKATANNKENKAKTAFFITPLDSDNSAVRRNTDGVIKAVIRPVLLKHNIILTPPHEIDEPGNITRQIIAQILTADLVIADLTGLNPNVMYELAVRHARRLPIIVICQHGTKLPFDIAAERTFFYYNDFAGSVQLFEQLDKTIPKALEDEKPINPIYNGLETSIIQQITEEGNDPVRTYIVEKLAVVDELSSMVRGLVNSQQDTVSTRTNILDKEHTKILFRYKGNLSMSEIESAMIYISNNLPNNLRLVHTNIASGAAIIVEIWLPYTPANKTLNRILSVTKATGFDMSPLY